MTLILTLVTQDFVIQASDRRLSSTDGDLFEDEENKAICYNGNMLLAYTGLARVDRKSTAEWLIGALSKLRDLDHLFKDLPGIAGRQFIRIRRPRQLQPDEWRRARRTSFVLAGYAEWRGAGAPIPTRSDRATPTIISISNAEGTDGAWQSEATRHFTARGTMLSADTPLIIRASGQPLTAREERRLRRQLHTCIVHTNYPESAARLLARQIRDVSERNTGVGRSVMVTILPRVLDRESSTVRIVGRGFPLHGKIDEAALFRRFRLDDSAVTYVYYPGDPSHRMHYGPAYVSPGIVIEGTWSGPEGAAPKGC